MTIRVLLADDHTIIRDGLRLLLEAQPDIQVVADAADGLQAVEQAQALQPDIVVIDITMPHLNGIEATRQIRERCSHTQVIILSMHATNEHIFRALRAGASGYLLKEAAGQEVVQAIRTVAQGEHYLSSRVTSLLMEDYIRHRERAPNQSPLEQLSAREREILQLVVEGKSSAEIAELLSLSVKTVGTYRSRLMQKLGIDDLPGLVKFAIQQGLISLD